MSHQPARGSALWKLRVLALGFGVVGITIAMLQYGDVPLGDRVTWRALLGIGVLLGLLSGVGLVLFARSCGLNAGEPSRGLRRFALMSRWTVVPFGAGLAGLLSFASPVATTPIIAFIGGFFIAFAMVPPKAPTVREEDAPSDPKG